MDRFGVNAIDKRFDLPHFVFWHVDDQQYLSLLDLVGELLQSRIGNRGADQARGHDLGLVGGNSGGVVPCGPCGRPWVSQIASLL